MMKESWLVFKAETFKTMVTKRWQSFTVVFVLLFFSFVYLSHLSTTPPIKFRNAEWPKNTFYILYQNATFLIEVSGKPDLSFRQTCAIEAAVAAHSGYPVIVYMTGYNGTSFPWMESSPNLYVTKLNLDELLLDTHLENVYRSNNFRKNPIVEHVADLSRIALLKKHGGLYLDIDMILMKPVLDFGSFVLKDQGNGVLRFDETSPLLAKIYELLGNVKYNRGDYTLLGAKIIKKAVSELCYLNDNDLRKAEEKCHINFVDNKLFAPVAWHEFTKLFKKDISLDNFRPEIMKKALAFHFAGHMTKNIPVFKNGSSLFNEIAKKFCPKIYKSFPDVY